MPLLLCDLDETLVDRAGAFHRWARDFAHRYDAGDHFANWLIDIDDDGTASREAFFEAVKTRLGLDATTEELLANYHRTYSTFFQPEPSVATALETARRAGWTIAVVTNGDAHQTRKIAAVGLEPHLDVVCISAVEDAWKPDPRLLQIAAARAGLGLDGDSWMIGDNAHADIGAAVAAEIRSVWLRRGRQWPRSDYAPTAEADTFACAVDIVLASQRTGLAR